MIHGSNAGRWRLKEARGSQQMRITRGKPRDLQEMTWTAHGMTGLTGASANLLAAEDSQSLQSLQFLVQESQFAPER